MITTDQILDCFDYWLVVDADQNIVAENLMFGFATLAQLFAVTFNELQAQAASLEAQVAP